MGEVKCPFSTYSRVGLLIEESKLTEITRLTPILKKLNYSCETCLPGTQGDGSFTVNITLCPSPDDLLA